MPVPEPTAPRSPRCRTLSLRGLLILVALIAIPLGWKVRRASVQRRAVAAVERLGGEVTFDWQRAAKAESTTPDGPNIPRWLRRVAGDALFQEVVEVKLSTRQPTRHPGQPSPPITAERPDWHGLDDREIQVAWATERINADQLVCLEGLDRLEELELDHVQLDPRGLERLTRLTRVQSVVLEGTVRHDDLAALARMPRLRDLEVTDYHFDRWLPGAPTLPHLRKLIVYGLAGEPGLAWALEHRDLTEFQIRSMAVDDAILARVRVFPRLTRLECWRCEGVTDAGLAALAPLSELRGLELWETHEITDAGLAHLTRLNHLEEVDLCQSPKITDAGLAHLARLPELRQIRLRGSALITDAGLAHVRQNRHLQWLELGFASAITDAGLTHLVGLPELVDVDFQSASAITDVGLATLATIPQLETITLGSTTGITDAGLAQLQKLRNLEMLSLADAPDISDAGLVHLLGLPKFGFLGLQASTKVTDAGLITLAKLPALHTLRLHRSRVTPAGLAALKANHPDLFDDIEFHPPLPADSSDEP